MKVFDKLGTIYSEMSLADILKLCPGDPANYSIEVTNEYDSAQGTIYLERDATPEEVEAQRKQQEAEDLYYAQHRRQQYERLKQEFG
jgi:hypothetical protein